jgi:hypothetical protein
MAEAASDVRLVRFARNLGATYGALAIGDTPVCVSIEPPWRENERDVSCIPGGPLACPVVYQCVRGLHRLEGGEPFETFEVIGVPGRSGILFHRGNIVRETRGCIIVGEAFNPVLGQPGVTDSGHAFAEFMSLFRLTDRFQLSVIEAIAQ